MLQKVLLCVLLSISAAVSQKLEPCTNDLIRYSFTPCNSVTQTRQSVSYFARPCDTSNGVTLSTPRSAPCNKACPSGQFYSAVTLDCATCPAGTSSSTSLSYGPYPTWPSEFVTYCSPSPCQPWRVEASQAYIASGDQNAGGPRANGDDTVASTLSMMIVIKQVIGGSITFTYLVESEENHDGLAIMLNGTRQIYSQAHPFLATGLQRTWTTRQIPLPFGTTEIRFMYEKDSDKFSASGLSSGLDKAFLREIIIEGTKQSNTNCNPCPAGFKSGAGATSCLRCPANTFSLGGSTDCTPCPDGTFSLSGSGQCTQKAPCNAQSDYQPMFTPCDKATNSRSLQYQVVNPYCNANGTFTPEPQRSIPCAECPPGLVRIGSGSAASGCKPCDGGRFASGPDAAQCQLCSPGTAAVPSLKLPDFNFTGDIFTTRCSGMCRGCPRDDMPCETAQGWEPFSFFLPGAIRRPIVGMYSGASLGAQATSIIATSSTLVVPGSVTFEYSFYRRPSSVEVPTDWISKNIKASFFIDSVIEYPLPAQDCTDPTIPCRVTLPLSEVRTYDLSWVFTKDFVFDALSPISLVLRSLEIVGDIRGGATACSDCPVGYSCPDGQTLIRCPIGTFSNTTGRLNCLKCNQSQYTSDEGQAQCQTCPVGSSVNANSTGCTMMCNSLTDGPFVYDLSRLQSLVIGPVVVDGQTITSEADMDAKNIFRFYISLCQSLSNQTTPFPPCPAVGNPNVCQRINNAKSTNLGNSMTYKGNGFNGVTLTFGNGDRCGSSGTKRVSVIKMLCDPDRSNINGVMRFVSESPPCQLNFELLIRDACPACNALSYGRSEEPCDDNGNRSVSYFKLPEAQGCFGGTSLPSRTVEACNRCQPDWYLATWSSCDQKRNVQTKLFALSDNYTSTNCIQTADSFPPRESRACRVLKADVSGVNPFTIIIFIILVTTVVVGVYLAWTAHKKAALAKRIAELEQASGAPATRAGAVNS